MEKVNLSISKFLPSAWAKQCDACKSSNALLYCRSHTLFLCITCDSNIHAPHAPPHAPPLGFPHERVWLCEVCEYAPASVTCKADAAALCVACDRDIHSANPLARRHERVPVIPFTTTASVAATAIAAATEPFSIVENDVTFCSHDVITPSEWTFPKVEPDLTHVKCADFMFSDTDQFLDFDGSGTDSVVPVQTMRTYEEATAREILNQLSSKYVEIDFTNSKFSTVNNQSFVTQSLSQSISSSSMDVGVVPDGGSISDISYPHIRPGNKIVEFPGPVITASQGLDREARVMRYREKRKNRKFEKTIRYASRKAYAETRPRIKGRFAKRTETEPEPEPEPEPELMDHMFMNSSSFMNDTIGFGIVPTF